MSEMPSNSKPIVFSRNAYKEFATLGLLIGALVLCVIGAVPILNAVLFIPFAVLLYCLSNVNKSRGYWLSIFLIPTVLLGFFIAIFRPSGFDYPLVWSAPYLYEGGKEFLLFANLSKAIGGFLVIVWLFDRYGNTSFRSIFSPPGKNTLLIVAGGIFSVLATAALFFGVGWQPKLSEGIFYFAIVNLFVTVVSEEAFFRLLLHNNIAALFSNAKTGAIWGVIITTLLFTLSHTAAFGPVFFLYLFAGFIYAFSYAYTKSLLACISVHFGVNILHFVFLEYPL